MHKVHDIYHRGEIGHQSDTMELEPKLTANKCDM